VVLPVASRFFWEARGRLAELGFRRLHPGLGRLEFGFLLDGVEACQHLGADDGFADVDQALADFAADPEGKFGLDLGCNDAGKGDGRCKIDQLGGRCLDARERPLGCGILLAAGKQSEQDNGRARQDQAAPAMKKVWRNL